MSHITERWRRTSIDWPSKIEGVAVALCVYVTVAVQRGIEARPSCIFFLTELGPTHMGASFG